MSPMRWAAPAGVELFPVSTQLPAISAAEEHPQHQGDLSLAAEGCSPVLPQAASIASSHAAARRACKNSTRAAAAKCSASYARKNMYKFHMHKEEALKTRRMQ